MASLSLPAAPPEWVDSRHAAWRLLATLLIMTLGNSAMYSVAVVLPAVQAEFNVARADASMPYTAMMLGFGVGGLLMGRLADRFGVVLPVFIGGCAVMLGYAMAGASRNVLEFSLVHGLLLGLLGCSATFAPLMADTTQWWARRRGIAVAVCASGNYLAGTIWPPILQHFVGEVGWRATYTGVGLVCGGAMLVLAMAMRRRPPAAVITPELVANNQEAALATGQNVHQKTLASRFERPFGLPAATALLLLCVAGVACCVAMSMPQVHIVAYCTDLGYGAARGAQMLSLMMATGIASRLISGAICDRIGGLRTLMLGSVLQGIALLLFLPFDGLVPLFLVAGLFGLFQGGIVPSYAIIVREYFGTNGAGFRTGAVIMATMIGMALGGWMSGKVFDLTGSYHAAFINGILWNLLNIAIVLGLWWRLRSVRART